MLPATFSIPLHQLTPSFIEKIRAFIGEQSGEPEVLISVLPQPTSASETREAYFSKLEQALADVERGEVVSFDSVEDWEEFVAWYRAADDDDFEEHMSDEQVAELGEAIAMTYDPSNLIPQSEAKKLVEQWLLQRQSNG